ncbi:MAG: gliding motility-associated C-terminal domain-containing protein [Cyclobacteriaceae bacterium]
MRTIYALFLLLIGLNPLNGQVISESQWFFGNSSANLQFDKNGDEVYDEERMTAPFGMGGSAVANSSTTGNLLFYTDGERIYDESGAIMSNSTSLGGSPDINQPAVISSMPGFPNMYYVFVNVGTHIEYTLIDMNAVGNGTADAPLGAVVTSGLVTRHLNPSEGMTIIKTSEDQYWLISQNNINFDFMVSQVGTNGLDTTMTFAFDTTNQLGYEVAQMDFNADSMLLAVAPKDQSRNVWLLNVGDSAQFLSFNSEILRAGYTDGAEYAVFDVEWSPNGSKLYFSRYGGVDTLLANVYQYDLGDTAATSQVVRLLPNNLYRSYGLQTAIDDRMYHLYQQVQDGPYLLGRFEQPDSAYDVVNYVPQFYDIDFNGRQFPMFSPGNFNTFSRMEFKVLDTCQGNVTKIFPLVEPTPNQFLWNLNGNSTNVQAPLIDFGQANSVNGTLEVELNGVRRNLAVNFGYGMNDLEPDLGNDTVICVTDSLVLDPFANAQQQQGQPAPTPAGFIWSTGETTPTITVDTAGTYWVAAIHANGCRAFSEITIEESDSTGIVSAQTQNQWYFGERAGLDFNTQPPTPITDDNLMSSPEACASISDVAGELIFYTDGNTIYNKDHEPMQVLDTAGGTVLGGDNTATQGTTILPFMNDEDDQTMFYVFTAMEVYGTGTYDLRYSIVDLKHDSARGAVVARNIPLYQKSTEKITPSGFTNQVYLAGHEFGNNSFRSNLITDAGILPSTFSPIGEVLRGQDERQAEGAVKFSSDLTLLANTIPGPNYVEIFDFDFNTGKVSEVRQIDTEETGDLLYGLEFSSGGTRLYVTTSNKLIQYKLDSLVLDSLELAIAEIQDSKYDDYDAEGNTLGALQRSSSGTIYLAKENANTLGTINTPSGDDDLVGFSIDGQDLGGRMSRRGLPNFTQNSSDTPQQPGQNHLAGCFGQDTEFFAVGLTDIDEFFWDFDVMNDSLPFPPTGYGENVTTAYAGTGWFTYELNITNRCGVDLLFTDSLEVFGIPEQPIVPEDALLCNGPLELAAWDDASRTDLNYYWSTGETTRTILIDRVDQFNPTDRRVAIINDQGCSSDTVDFFVQDGQPFADLGPDVTHCQFSVPPQLDANNALDFVAWTVNDVETDTGRFASINTQSIGTYEYAMYIEDDFGCYNSDTLLITIDAAPDITPSFTPPSNCGELDAIIDMAINSTGSYEYELITDSGSFRGFVQGPTLVPSRAGLGAGNYAYLVTDQTTGCAINEPVFIEDDTPFDVNARNLPDCETDLNVSIVISGLDLPDRVDLYAINTTTGDSVSQYNITVPIRTPPTLPDGIYNINVVDTETGCFKADSVLIEPYWASGTDCEPEIFAPSAFSPNGNNQNEDFYVYPNVFVDQFEIYIYSRWGELVFYSDDKYFRWDGQFRSETLPPGTYAYIIKYTNLEEPGLGELSQRGSVMLVR